MRIIRVTGHTHAGIIKEKKTDGVSVMEYRDVLEQARKNISAMLDAIMVDYPQETLEILALVCFIEPEDVDKHTMREYLLALNEILSDEAVIGFFISLARLGAMNTPNASTI